MEPVELCDWLAMFEEVATTAEVTEAEPYGDMPPMEEFCKGLRVFVLLLLSMLRAGEVRSVKSRGLPDDEATFAGVAEP